MSTAAFVGLWTRLVDVAVLKALVEILAGPAGPVSAVVARNDREKRMVDLREMYMA